MLAPSRDFELRAYGPTIVVSPHAPSAALMSATQSLRVDTLHVTTAVAALQALPGLEPSLIVVDEDVDDLPAPVLIRLVRAALAHAPIVVLAKTAVDRTNARVVAGADAVIERTAPADRLSSTMSSVLRRRAAEPPKIERGHAEFFQVFASLFRRGSESRQLEKTVADVASRDDRVQIIGESGAGKKTVARAVHYLSERTAGALVLLNCAGYPPDLLQQELFGGPSAPGAVKRAHGGSLILGDYDLLPPSAQDALLDVLRESASDIRLIGTTRRPASGAGRIFLPAERTGAVSTISVSPLRERPDDIPGLAEYFRLRFMEQYHRDTPPLSDTTMARLIAYPWPGNVLELENLLKRHVVLGERTHLLDELGQRTRLATATGRRSPALSETSLREIGRRAAREAETAAMLETLKQVNWNRAEAARLLKVSYKTLLNKLIRAGIAGKPPADIPRRGDAP